MLTRTFLIAVSLLSSFSFAADIEIKGLLQTQLALSADEQSSYLEGGTGLFRHDEDNRWQLSQAVLELKGNITDNLTFHSVLNHTQNPQAYTGFTQLSLRYKPIWSNKYRWQFRAGMFYPEMGFENPDIGWLSPYAYTNSAINSWIGEEVRTLGGEFKVTRPGRAHGRSPHTFAWTGAFFKGNDPTGTLLAWRGWGLHDKQTIANEIIPFSDVPSLNAGDGLDPQEPWVDPFREIDGRWGYQTGLHWDYQKKSRVRYYYFNNNADETVLARGGQYAWHTIFHSLAWQYRFDRNWRLIMQGMDGNTSMGPGAVIVDFRSWYAMLHYRDKQKNFTVRFDNFKTIDVDELFPLDDNNSDGWGLTATYRYNINDNWQVGTEVVYVDSFQASREQLGQEGDIEQTQFLAVAQFRF